MFRLVYINVDINLQSLLLLGPWYDCFWLYALILNESITNGTGTDLGGTDMIAASAFYDYIGKQTGWT